MKTPKIHKIFTVALFAAISLTIPVITLINSAGMPEKPFSETENRYLQVFPKISFDTITDKSFMEDFQDYFSDRIFLREEWINLKNSFDRLLGQKEIKGIFTEDGRMIESWKSYNREMAEKNLAAMESFAQKYSNINMYFMLAPNAQEIYKDTLPANCGAENQKAFIKMCYDNTPSITGIDVYSPLYASRNDYIYYRTDHHWTSFGAYLAYNAASSAMHFTPSPIDKFSIEHASDSFRGTLYSKTLDSSIVPDTIDYYTLAQNDPPLKMTVYSGNDEAPEIYDSLYFREYLSKKDKYSSLLGTLVPRIDIETELPKESDNGSLLVIKDSYAHALVPFLTKNYSKITVIDLRFINTSLADIGVNINDYQTALFMYNVITFSETDNPSRLNFS